MTPGQQSRRENTEEMRRQQQADEPIRELEQEVERLRGGLLEIMDYIEARREDGPMSGEVDGEALWSIANSALDGEVVNHD